MDEVTRHAIRSHAGQLLQQAGVDGVLPTPLDQLHVVARLDDVVDLQPLSNRDLPLGLRAIAAKVKNAVLAAAAVRERTIFVDHGLAVPRRRFAHAHELGHTLLPWQQRAYVADDRGRLDPQTRELFEQEANLFAAELLYQTDQFRRSVDEHPLSLSVPVQHAEPYGVSIHSAVRRYASQTRHCCGLIALGRFLGTARGGGRRVKVLYTVESPSFVERFGPLQLLLPQWLDCSEHPIAKDAADLVTGRRDGVLSGELILTGPGSVVTRLEYELLFNRITVLALVRRRRVLRLTRTVQVRSAAS